MRASLPLNTFPFGSDGSSKTGQDLSILTAYLIDVGNPGISFGVGQCSQPQLQLKMSLVQKNGLLASRMLALTQQVRCLHLVYLLTWQMSFAGEGDRDDVNTATLQYIALYQLGGGWYLRSAPVLAYNFEDDSYTVPLRLGIGKVIPTDKVVMNLFVEPRFLPLMMMVIPGQSGRSLLVSTCNLSCKRLFLEFTPHH